MESNEEKDFEYLCQVSWSNQQKICAGDNNSYDDLLKLSNLCDQFLLKYPEINNSFQQYLDEDWLKYNGHFFFNKKQALEMKPINTSVYLFELVSKGCVSYLNNKNNGVGFSNTKILKDIFYNIL